MGNTADQITTQRRPLPTSLTKDIEQAGYYPALVADVVESALAGDDVVSHLVHQETTFDQDSVRRHVTVLALTPTRLVVAHADDHAPEQAESEPDHAGSQTEAEDDQNGPTGKITEGHERMPGQNPPDDFGEHLERPWAAGEDDRVLT